MPSPSLVIKFYLFYHQNISRIHHIASTSVVTPLTSHFSPLTALLTLLFRCHPPKNVIHQTSGWVTLITQTLPISPHYLKNQVQTLCISIKTEPFSALLYLHAHCTLSKPFFFSCTSCQNPQRNFLHGDTCPFCQVKLITMIILHLSLRLYLIYLSLWPSQLTVNWRTEPWSFLHPPTYHTALSHHSA